LILSRVPALSEVTSRWRLIANHGIRRHDLGMVRYRRNRLPGGTYFFTVTLHDRKSAVLTDHIDLFRSAVRNELRHRRFSILGAVILPEHLHMIWRLPPNDSDYPRRWQSIKAGFTRGLGERGVHLECGNGNAYRLWQSRYWEHTIHDEADLRAHLDYIHYNPVKHGLVDRVRDWPFSSFHSYVRRSQLPLDWAGTGVTNQHAGFGE